MQVWQQTMGLYWAVEGFRPFTYGLRPFANSLGSPHKRERPRPKRRSSYGLEADSKMRAARNRESGGELESSLRFPKVAQPLKAVVSSAMMGVLQRWFGLYIYLVTVIPVCGYGKSITVTSKSSKYFVRPLMDPLFGLGRSKSGPSMVGLDHSWTTLSRP
jgi:hypothetical protein